MFVAHDMPAGFTTAVLGRIKRPETESSILLAGFLCGDQFKLESISGLWHGRGRVAGHMCDGVAIETTGEEVFLGHAEPGRMVRDLDLRKAARTQQFH
jgi:hypothetical protein